MGNFAKRARQRGFLLGLGIFLAAMALVAAAFRIAHNERAFELNRWETRLHTDAVQPVDMVSGWLSASRDALRAVAENPTVQIYLSQAAVANPAPPVSPESEAQGAFLESYIISLGSHGPFAASSGAARSATGLAVLDAQRHVVAATSGYRPSPQTIVALIAKMRDGSAGPLVSSAAANSPNAFLVAVRPIQAAMSAPPVGYVIGERRLDEGFWASDGSVIATDHGHESLVSVGPDGATHLVGSSVTGRVVSADSGEYLAARTPLHLQRARDMKGRDALHLGVPVKGADWVLVESVPASSALAGVEARIRNLLTILLLSLLAIILGILALWRHMTGIQQAASREASMKLYRGVAEVLLQAIDQRDPGAAEHSRRVAALSRDIALKMGAAKAEADAAELAGALMNVGKLFVPVNLLTKAGELDDAEVSQFADGSARWLDLLARTPFDPPLEPILRDAYRLGYGQAPEAGGVARNTYIIVAANKAVALMSPRAYRMAHSPVETLEILSAPDHAIPEPIRAALADILITRR
ncbi:MAG: hypothetical protein JSR55_02565 [Proteobacteria bacterium]|nr:hypothetical protein [Pseudomonadota bacterium]